MNVYVEFLKEAISKIDSEYYTRNESDFVMELYHRMRDVFKLPNNVKITSQTHKNQFDIENDAVFRGPHIRRLLLDNRNNERLFFRYPDLLIHETDTKKNQLLAIEVKKNHNAQGIEEDLAKLIVLCKGQLKYKKGILIVIAPLNTNFMDVPSIEEMLKNTPEVEIWIVRHGRIEIYCSKNSQI